MAGLRKADDTKQDRRQSRQAQVIESQALDVPAALEAWLPEIKEQWDWFWTTELSSTIDRGSLAVLQRLFKLRNEQAVLWQIADASETLTAGSTGQQKLNPAIEGALKLEPLIVALEDRLGLSSKAKANLGIATGQALLTAEQLRALARDKARELETEMNTKAIEVTEDREHYQHYIRS